MTEPDVSPLGQGRPTRPVVVARWAGIAIALVSLAIGAAFVSVVPPGLPYDEPSHLDVVASVAALGGLPVVGRPGVTHEALQPPLYYGLAGLLWRPLRAHLESLPSIYVLRSATLLAFTAFVYLVYVLAIRTTGNVGVASSAAAFVGLNPALIAIAASVQNDSLMFLISTAALYAMLVWSARSPPTYTQSAALGLLVGLAVMTKTSALPLAGFVPAVLVVRGGATAVPKAGLVVGVILLAGGWWFVRNVHVYHDWSGASAWLSIFGQSGKLRPRSWPDWVWSGREFIAYYTVPVEYWRNEVKASRVDRAIVVAECLWVMAGLVTRLRTWGPGAGRRPAAAADNGAGPMGSRILQAFAALCVAFWLYLCLREYIVAPRIAMAGVAGVGLFVGLGSEGLAARLRPGRRWLAWGGLPVMMLCLDLSLLRAVSRLPRRQPFLSAREVARPATTPGGPDVRARDTMAAGAGPERRPPSARPPQGPAGLGI